MRYSTFRFEKLVQATIAVLLTFALATPVAVADPPPWAPAHGYRDKHKSKHKHDYDSDSDDRYGDYDDYDDYDDYSYWAPAYGAQGYVAGGRCNREAIGGLLGGTVGGVIGAQARKGDGRTAAIIAGTVVGVLVGRSIGRSMDAADQHCVGHTLEYAMDRQPVMWENPDNGHRYAVTPIGSRQVEDRYCREYMTEATVAGSRQVVYGTACRQPDGSWELNS